MARPQHLLLQLLLVFGVLGLVMRVYFSKFKSMLQITEAALSGSNETKYFTTLDPLVNVKQHGPTLADRRPLNNVFIFYFVFIPPNVKHWSWLVASQLKDLKATGLLNAASLSVIAATDPNSPTAREDMMLVASVVKENTAGATNSVTVSPRYGNRYEYWGLHSMWQKAMSQDIGQRNDSVFLYMHSRGMVNHGNMTEAKRAWTDGFLFKNVIEPWRDVLFRFRTVPELDKAGFTISPKGFAYFNFMWVRSSYVTRLEAPVERPRNKNRGGGGGQAAMQNVTRHYYEHWIAHTTDQPPSGSNGWSMALQGFHIGVCVDQRATEAALISAVKKMRKLRVGDDGVFNCSKSQKI